MHLTHQFFWIFKLNISMKRKKYLYRIENFTYENFTFYISDGKFVFIKNRKNIKRNKIFRKKLFYQNFIIYDKFLFFFFYEIHTRHYVIAFFFLWVKYVEAIIIMNRQIASKISKILFTYNFFIIHFLCIYSIYTYILYNIYNYVF